MLKISLIATLLAFSGFAYAHHGHQGRSVGKQNLTPHSQKSFTKKSNHRFKRAKAIRGKVRNHTFCRSNCNRSFQGVSRWVGSDDYGFPIYE